MEQHVDLLVIQLVTIFFIKNKKNFYYFFKSHRLRIGGGKQLRRVHLATSFLLLVSSSITPLGHVIRSETSWGKQRL